ncbi:polysaccharide deacetylase family protein [Anaerotignum sp.]|uniref:polysaccharide deacetylase family protein n=1 Tax=Anaerotignum sp. TaxID=2039241 RepID=UPI0027150D2A|nr:polysaccharide deacetylase family protein [Anaerotignum sp.]
MKRRKWMICLLVLAVALGLCGCGQNNAVSAAEPLMLPVEPIRPVKTERKQLIGEKESMIEYAAPLAYVLAYPHMSNEEINNQILDFVQGLKGAFAEQYDVKDEKEKRRLTQKDCDKFLYLDYDSYVVSEDKVCIVFYETQELGQDVLPVERVHIFHFDTNTGQRIVEKDIRKDGFLEAASAYTIQYFTQNEPYKDRIFGDYKTTLAPDAGRFERFALNSEGVIFYFDRYDIFPGSLGRVDLLIPYSELPGLLNGVGVEAPPVAEEEETEPIQPIEKPEREIDPDKPMVALTFDDGPKPAQTERILDALEKYGVVATFFDLGSLVEAYPDTVKRELELGCEVGSHSYSHKNFNTLSEEAIAEDVKKTEEAFRNTIGVEPTVFRPPYGNCNDFVKEHIPLAMVTWSVDTLDWKSKDPDAIMKVIRSQGDLDGKVILMHGIYETSAEATEELVPYLLKQGYQLVTVSEMAQYKHGEQLEAGKLYGYSYFQ